MMILTKDEEEHDDWYWDTSHQVMMVDNYMELNAKFYGAQITTVVTVKYNYSSRPLDARILPDGRVEIY